MTFSLFLTSQHYSLPKGPPGQEFYVKWKGRSFLHCSWVSEQVVQKAISSLQAALTAGLKQRLSKFWRDHQAGSGLAGADEGGEEGAGAEAGCTGCM